MTSEECSVQHFDAILMSVKVYSHECLDKGAKQKNELIIKLRNLHKTGTVLQSTAYVYQIHLFCDI